MRVDMEWVRRAFGGRETEVPSASRAGRHAVVAAILRDSAEGAEVLLIRRAEHELDPWSGHMALPGGHVDAGDASLVATAVREISEEVGLDLLGHARLLGPLPELVAAPAQLTIFPLVFELAPGPEPEANPKEVAEVVWTTIEHLRSPLAKSSYELSVRQQRHIFPAFDVRGRTVWGLTYRILGNLLSTLEPASEAGAGEP
jgi:8-oxo-dGTP pyrophosphatase MutT (NUDIX family)